MWQASRYHTGPDVCGNYLPGSEPVRATLMLVSRRSRRRTTANRSHRIRQDSIIHNWENVMRKTIAAASATAALLFGGAGIANAAIESSPVPSSTTTTVAQTDNGQNQKGDKTGLWGLLGLLGLGGLAGLRGRRQTQPGAGGVGTAGPTSRI